MHRTATAFTAVAAPASAPTAAARASAPTAPASGPTSTNAIATAAYDTREISTGAAKQSYRGGETFSTEQHIHCSCCSLVN